MDEQQRLLNRRYEMIVWGAFFIWWGVTTLFSFLPGGVGEIGIGLILLGLNVARALNKIPTSAFTITLGVIALVLGGVELLRSIFRLPFELPIFPVLLILLGAILLVRAITRAPRS